MRYRREPELNFRMGEKLIQEYLAKLGQADNEID